MDPEAHAAAPEVLASYYEKRPGQRCRFDLYKDRIVSVGSRQLSVQFMHPFHLNNLDPVYGIARSRSAIAGPGSLILGSMFFFLLVFGWFHGLEPRWIGAAISGSLAIACFVTGFRNFRMIESYFFNLRSGQLAFHVSRCGPDVRKFDGFVAQLVQAIKSANAAEASPENPG